MRVELLQGIMVHEVARERAARLGGHLPGNVPMFWDAGVKQQINQVCYDNSVHMIHLDKPGRYYLPDRHESGSVEDTVDKESWETHAVVLIPDQMNLDMQ